MILHIITNFSKTGGAETSLRRFVLNCPEHRHTIVSLMTADQRDALRLGEKGIAVSALGHESAYAMAAGPWAFRAHIDRIQPQVILCWMYHANAFGSLAAGFARHKAPVFWAIRHSLDNFWSESASTKTAILANCLLSGRADGIAYCSQRSREQHERFGFASQRSTFIPNGYEFDSGGDLETTTPKLRKDKLTVGVAGRYHKAKDYPTMLAAAARVVAQNPQAEFVLAGKGVSLENPEFAALVREAGLDERRVKLLGEVEEMARFYSQLDVFVLSSITEGFPNVLAEAMAHGVPCVTTDVGDAPYIVDDCGKVVPTRSPEQLAAAILDLLAMPEPARLELGRRAAESVRTRFDIRRVVSAYLNFLGLGADPVGPYRLAPASDPLTPWASA